MIVHHGPVTFPAGEIDLERYRRVRFDAANNRLVYADEGERSDGTLQKTFIAANDRTAAVVPLNYGSTRKLVAGEEIDAYGYFVFGSAGMIFATANGEIAHGRLQEISAAEEGDEVEGMIFSNAAI